MKTIWEELFGSRHGTGPLTPRATRELADAVTRVETLQQTAGHQRILGLIQRKLQEPPAGEGGALSGEESKPAPGWDSPSQPASEKK